MTKSDKNNSFDKELKDLVAKYKSAYMNS